MVFFFLGATDAQGVRSAFIMALAGEGPERDTLMRSAKRAEAAEIDGDLLLHVAKDPR